MFIEFAGIAQDAHGDWAGGIVQAHFDALIALAIDGDEISGLWGDLAEIGMFGEDPGHFTSESVLASFVDVEFDNGSFLEIITARENARGKRIHCALIDDTIDKDFVDCVLKPMLRPLIDKKYINDAILYFHL